MDDRKRPARGDEKPAAKKHKDNVQSSHRLDALDSLVLETVFSFLDSRTLFNVAFCSKAIRARITHEAVVRSAVLSGGVATKTIQRMTFLLELRAIWVPSPLRLLRLVNGRSCERGDLCCYRDPNNTLICYFVHGPGLFFCGGCYKGATTENSSEQVHEDCRFPYHCREDIQTNAYTD